ncbi:amidohydrolase family protein [Erwinia sp.]|uniref:amidohydrolase family protein n=1 Tax=Erwinia citreus TaxID=558 RepID=UPI003C7929DC
MPVLTDSQQKVCRIRARWVVGYENGDHQLYQEGEVVWQGAQIVFVGHGFSGPVDEEIAAGNTLVGPGFIDLDALGDVDTTVLGFDNQPGWRKGRVVAADWVRRDLYNRDQLNFSKRYAYSQLLRNGITTALPITSILYREWAETFDEYCYAADVAESLGIRAYLGPAFMSGYHVVEADGRIALRLNEAKGLRGLEQAISYVERLEKSNSATVKGMLAPDRIEGGTPALFNALSQAVNSLHCPTRLHCCQSQLEVNEVASRFAGKSSLEVLEDFSLLNRHMLLPHGQFLGGPQPDKTKISADIARLASAHATLISCPLVSGRHGNYLESFNELREKGVNLALGTDTFPPDMVSNMHIGTILSRVVAADSTAASAAEYYRMATLGGAKALGREDLGRLAAGAQADIVLFDLDEPAMGQVFDPITALVINGNGRDVKGVIVAGEKVLWDRQLVKPGYDLDQLHQEAGVQLAALQQTYPERSWQHPDVSEIFTSSFLIRTPSQP